MVMCTSPITESNTRTRLCGSHGRNDHRMHAPPTSTWYLYIVRCADHSLYTGITTNLERRLTEHNSGRPGAKYTRARRPVELVYQEQYDDRSTVSIRESEIKKMTPAQKRQLITKSRQR